MTDFLFNMPSVISGVASLLDIGGTLVQYNDSRTPDEADIMALRSDFLAIGNDMRSAMSEIDGQ